MCTVLLHCFVCKCLLYCCHRVAALLQFIYIYIYIYIYLSYHIIILDETSGLATLIPTPYHKLLLAPVGKYYQHLCVFI
jgi:hypothetical protein